MGISKKGWLLACIEAKSISIEEIKAKISEYSDLDEFRTKIAIGKSQGAFLYGDGVLNYKGRMCVLRVHDLIPRLLVEAHGLPYSIHLGVTKMYRDMERVYW